MQNSQLLNPSKLSTKCIAVKPTDLHRSFIYCTTFPIYLWEISIYKNSNVFCMRTRDYIHSASVLFYCVFKIIFILKWAVIVIDIFVSVLQVRKQMGSTDLRPLRKSLILKTSHGLEMENYTCITYMMRDTSGRNSGKKFQPVISSVRSKTPQKTLNL